MMKGKLALMLMFCSITLASLMISYSASAGPSIHTLGIEEQLSSSHVTDIIQDDLGFLWIATEDGLNRYNGYDIQQYTQSNSKLSHNHIKDLSIDTYGNIWIATVDGLNVFEKETGLIRSYFYNPNEPYTLPNDHIMKVEADSKGGVWIATLHGISYFSPELSGFKLFPIMENDNTFSSINEVRQITITEKDEVWLITTLGDLAKLNPIEERFQLVSVKESGHLGEVSAVQESPTGEMWVASYIKGLQIYNFDEQSLTAVNLKKLGIETSIRKVTAIHFISEFEVWIGTYERGLYRLDLKNKKAQHFNYATQESIANNSVTTLYQDANDILWIGTRSFLNKINLNSMMFKHVGSFESRKSTFQSVTALKKTQQGNLLVGSNKEGLGFIAHLGKNNESPLVINYPKALDSERILKFVKFGTERYWVITDRAVWLYDDIRKQVMDAPIIESGRVSFKSADIRGRVLWIGTSHGLWKVTEDGEVEKFTIINTDFHRDNTLNTLYIDKLNYVWLASENGIHRFNPQTEVFESLAQLLQDVPTILASSDVLAMHVDDTQRLWVGTFGGGLTVIDFIEQRSKTYNSSNSVIHDSIYSIEKEDHRFTWIATGLGLFRVNAENMSFTPFLLSENQPISEFNRGASTQVGDNLMFGGRNGFTEFTPTAYKGDEISPLAVIERATIDDVTVTPQQENYPHIALPITQTESLTLYPHNEELVLEFVGLSFIDPASHKYRYKLDGYDEEWVETESNMRHVTYKDLPSGEYQFKLSVANRDGVWSESPKVLNITVEASPWTSFAAIILYIIALSVTCFTLAYWAQHRVQERRKSAKQLVESQERLRLSLWGSGDELWDWHIPSGALHLSNEWENDFPRDGIRSGYSLANSNIHPGDIGNVKQALNAHLSGKSEYFECTYRIRDDLTDWLWVLDRGKVVKRDEDNKPLRMAGTLKDVSELKATQRRLELIVKSFDNIADAVWILDKDFKYQAINKSFESITGFSEREVVGRRLKLETFEGVTENLFKQSLKHLHANETWHGELQAFHKDGSKYPIEINIDLVRDTDNEILNYVGVFSDITFRKQSERELRHLATVDQLTGLKNRRTFRHHIAKVFEATQEGVQHALLFIDLDNFKRINDSLGHNAGDELLINVSEILQRCAEPYKAFVARLGGDEFTILLENVDTWNQPATLAQSLISEFAQTLSLTASEVVVSPSIGLVMYPENGDNAEELLKNADTAMYYAKKKGKNTYQFYTRQMNEQAKMRLNLENDLRLAIERDEFIVFYQPKVSLTTGKISGLEALVRWRHPQRGLVMPSEFIPLAEESGFIIPISQNVIEKTCLQIKEWETRGLIRGKVAINLSAVQFYSENLWETVKNSIHIAKITPDLLEVEITEGMVMEDLEQSIQQMQVLRDMGISLALDDFGVGHSSLSNLKEFPIDTLKIDRSFVADIEESERDKNMVSSIVNLAHNLELKVVAEGVETQNQVRALQEMNCEEIQGFFFSKPIPPWEIEALLEDPEKTLDDCMDSVEDELW